MLLFGHSEYNLFGAVALRCRDRDFYRSILGKLELLALFEFGGRPPILPPKKDNFFSLSVAEVATPILFVERTHDSEAIGLPHAEALL